MSKLFLSIKINWLTSLYKPGNSFDSANINTKVSNVNWMLQEIVVNIRFTKIKTKVTVNLIDQKINSSIFKKKYVHCYLTLCSMLSVHSSKYKQK